MADDPYRRPPPDSRLTDPYRRRRAPAYARDIMDPRSFRSTDYPAYSPVPREAATIRQALQTREGFHGRGYDPGFTRPDRGARFGRSYGEPLGREDVTGTVIGSSDTGPSVEALQRPRALWGGGVTGPELKGRGYSDEQIAGTYGIESGGVKPSREKLYRRPIEAGTIDGKRVQIIGDHQIKIHDPVNPNGYSIQRTGEGGTPVSAHDYLLNHPQFQGHPDYLASRGQAGGGPTDYQKMVAARTAVSPEAHREGAGAAFGQAFRGEPTTAATTVPAAAAAKVGVAARWAVGGGQAGEPVSPVGHAARGLAPALAPTARELAMSPTTPSRSGGSPAEISAAPPPAAPPTGPFGHPAFAPSAAPIGQARNEAARISKPTRASPVPRTETSPKPIDTGRMSNKPTAGIMPPTGGGGTGMTRPTPPDWTQRRQQFLGFRQPQPA